MVIAVANGIARNSWYGGSLSELRAHQVSSLTLIVLVGLSTWALYELRLFRSSGEARATGSIWLVLTVAFEFLFGHYVMKNPWSTLLHDYNILAGRIWLLVLAWIMIVPYIVYRLRS
jgi:hypothetical protein